MLQNCSERAFTELLGMNLVSVNEISSTSIDARLWRASLLWRIVDGASAKALKVCARFSVGVVSDRELFRFETTGGTVIP